MKYRGVLWVDGFYEPHEIEGVKETENYYIYLPEKNLFPLAVVWCPWVNKETRVVLDTFSILTVAANEQLAEIHNVGGKDGEGKRMPLVLHDDQIEGWMNVNTRPEVESYFKPYDKEFKAHRVFWVTGARGINTNIPGIQDPI